MGKLTNADWWAGRTPEQQAAKAEARGELREAVGDFQATRREVRGRKRDKPSGLRALNTITIWLALPVLGFVLFNVVGLVVGFVLALVINLIRRR